MLNDYNHCDHLFLVFIHQKVRSFGRHTYLFQTGTRAFQIQPPQVILHFG